MSASEQNPQIRAQSKRPSESICANPQANSTHDTAGDLLAQLDQTRDDLADLLLEIDHIELQVNPQILNDYNVKIACFENDLLKAEIEVRRAKRKLALAQAQINCGQSITSQAIEEQLEKEFSEWEAQLNAHVQTYLEALENRAARRFLPEQDAHELKQLHRTLIKRLHPDANAGHEGECERFFLIAQAAYEHGDLELLRSIEVATCHLGNNQSEPAN